MTQSLVFALVLGLSLSALAKTGKPVETGDEPPIAAKLVVDPVQEADAIASGKVETGAMAPVSSQPAPAVEPPAKSEVAKLPESQIPVLTSAKTVKKGEASNLSRIMTTLGVLTVVLGGAIFALKRWAARGGRKNQNTRIKILTQHPLGSKKSLAIIQVAGESILVGITDQNISMLKTLSLIDDEFPEEVPKNFNNALDDFADEDGSGRGAREEFAMTGLGEIRDRVSTRLRDMKNF